MLIPNFLKSKLKRSTTFLKLYFKLIRKSNAKPPKKLSLEITEKCNLRCIMCNRNLGADHKERVMSFFDFKKILTIIPSVKHIDIMGFGEPFLNPDLFKMLEYGASNGVSFSITTNAQLLNEPIIKKLTNNIKSLWFSIDSLNSKKYESIRVGGNLGRLLRNIRLVHKLRPDIELVIQTILLKSNANELKKFVDLADELNAELRFIHPLTSDPKIDLMHMHNNQGLYKYVNEAVEYANSKGVRLSSRPENPTMSIKHNICFEPWKEPYIMINGDILACCFMHRAMNSRVLYSELYRKQKINVPLANYYMGNIFKQGFSDIWNGKAYKLLRKSVLATEFEGSVSFESLHDLRKQFGNKNRFNYCSICLWRLCCAC